jgi:rod shape-determining protein MreB
MVGRTPRNIESVRPILNGLISDPETADEMIGQFIRKVYARRTFGKPMVVLAVPSGLTNIQQHAMAASVQLACDGRMYLIEKPMAAAIGAGLPVFEAQTSMVVDIGGGTTELGIISNGRIKFSRSVHVGGDKVDEAIVGYLRSQRHLLVGEASAETMKREIGCAGPYFDGDGRTYELKGQHLLKRLPATISVTQREIVAAIAEPMRAIANAIRETVETAPSELTSRISISTITLTGGGAELAGIDRFLCEETGFAFVIAENPSTCVVVGAGRAMEDQKNELRLNPIDS